MAMTTEERIALIQKNVMINNASAFRTTENMEKQLAKEYRAVAKELKALMQDLIQRSGEWSYVEIAKFNRYNTLFTQINTILEKMGAKEISQLTDVLKEQYVDSTLRTVYSLGQAGALIKSSLNLINPKVVKEAVSYPWSSAMFSDRIWDNKKLLLKTLRTELTQSMISGDSMQQLGQKIDNVLNGGQFNSVRLARTEIMRITYVAENRVYEENKVERVKYLATVRSERTCKICGSTHGKIFERGKEPMLPRHPQCRCTYAPVIDDKEVSNTLIDDIRSNEGYQQWRAKQVKNIGTEKQVVKEHTILDGKYLPLTFSDTKGGKVSKRYYFADFGQKEYKIPKTDFNLELLEALAKTKSKEEFKQVFYDFEGKVYRLDDELETLAYEGNKAYNMFNSLYKASGYNIALNDDYAMEFEKALIGDLDKLSDKEKEALTIYTGSTYEDINGHLRFNSKVGQDILDTIVIMDSAMSKTQLQKDVLLQRGASIHMIPAELQDMMAKDLKSLVGMVIEDKAFMSTSISTSGKFSGELLLQIKAPKGTKGTYVAPISKFKREREFILPRGTKLKVADIEQVSDGFSLLCEIVE